AFNCYLIQTGDHTILIETGAGDKMDPRARERTKLPPVPDPLPEVISRHGIDPESIDIVINSHLRDSVAYIDANYDPLVTAGRMTLVEDGYEVVPGVKMHRTPGHTRDNMVITAESRGQTFCFLSDLVPPA